MKRYLILIFLMPLFAAAQDQPLIEQGISPDLYLKHVVAPKENIYSIGRMYNASPKNEIAPYNKLPIDKGLPLGDTIKIPLTATNFTQTNTAAPDETLIPVYHIVQDKEGLYRISVESNKVPIATLKQWNKITGNDVSSGTQLIIGYLKVKKNSSPLATATTPPVQAAPVVVKTVEVTPKAPLPALKKAPKEKPKTVEEVEEKPKPVEQPIVVAPQKNISSSFKEQYIHQTKSDTITTESGTAAIFKSTSGSDGKYYCLENTATPGMIIKITNNANGKSVYAKVLDMIPDIKQNEGLVIRVSNAAAEQLGIPDAGSKFECTLSY